MWCGVVWRGVACGVVWYDLVSWRCAVGGVEGCVICWCGVVWGVQCVWCAVCGEWCVVCGESCVMCGMGGGWRVVCGVVWTFCLGILLFWRRVPPKTIIE